MENIEEKLKDKDFWVSVNSIFKIAGGKRIPKGKTFSNEETSYFYLRPNEISVFRVDKDNIPFLSVELYNKLKKYKIVSGELCVSIVGTIGKVALINTGKLGIDKEKLILSENFVKLTSKREIENLFYYYYFWSFIITFRRIGRFDENWRWTGRNWVFLNNQSSTNPAQSNNMFIFYTFEKSWELFSYNS